MKRSTIIAIVVFSVFGACRNASQQNNPTKATSKKRPDALEQEKSSNTSKDASPTSPPKTELAHKVIYADRTSQGYLLLLSQALSPKALRRTTLKKLVQDKLENHLSPEDFDALLELIAIEPHATDLSREKIKTITEATTPALETTTDSPPSQRTEDVDKLAENLASKLEAQKSASQTRPNLLGLHIDHMPLGKGEKALIGQDILHDSILARDLSSASRKNLDTRQWIVLLRADYRISDHFLGLRLLQELVALVAKEHHAIIHDPDTLETMEVSGFSDRKLAANRLNIADQIAVIPFPDLNVTQDSIRLTTRGMRRFGSVDLELAGLPKNSMILQRATDFIYGVAKVLSQEADIDPSGLALEVQSILEIAPSDIQEAYGPKQPQSHCPTCKIPVQVHLVERKSVDTDALEYTVARIVAPRKTSDQKNYDHLAWIQTAFLGLFGSPSR